MARRIRNIGSLFDFMEGEHTASQVAERLTEIAKERTARGRLSKASIAELQRIALLEDFARRLRESQDHTATQREIQELERLFTLDQ